MSEHETKPVENKYTVAVAAKKGAWVSGQYAVSQVVAPLMAPVIIQAIDAITPYLVKYGINISVDATVLQESLGGAVFIGLFVAYDYFKVKTGKKWL